MPVIKTEFVPCDLCGSQEQELLFSKIDPVTREEFHLVECSCGLAFVNPMPAKESIADLYPPDYLKDKPHSLALYGTMMQYLPSAAGGKLLDVGCGRGDFINFAQHQGWRTEGVDLLDWGNPDNLSVRVGDFLSMDFIEGSYQVVTAWALLEHVRRPSAFFGRISSLLSEDGHFIFVVPNFSAPGMRRACAEDIPRHLHMFSPRSVAAYLSEHGMEIEKIYHNADLYTAYPFGLIRYFLSSLSSAQKNCARYENRSVGLLRGREFTSNLRPWLKEVLATVGPLNIIIDAVDLTAGVILANLSKLMRNYGVMTVVARPKR